MKIHLDNFSFDEQGNLLAEASTLRFPIGQWPTDIYVESDAGLARFRHPKPQYDAEGDLMKMTYEGMFYSDQISLVVFND